MIRPGQQMARVNISEEHWREFRSEAVTRNRSVAAYLGRLVRKELRRVARARALEEQRQVLRANEPPEVLKVSHPAESLDPWDG